MIPSSACIALIKQFEGCKLAAYLDTGGVPTIGWGHTKNVRMGDMITPQEAEFFLDQDLRDAASAILPWLLVPVTQGQFDALCSFVFNLGLGALKGSTLLRKINAKDTPGAAREFGEWVMDNGMVLRGLVRRRMAEAVLFLKDGGS